MSRQRQQGANYEDRLGDYIDVPARIAEFRTKHPEGSLQPADLSQPFRIERIGDQAYVVVVAAAYRTPDDPRPGIGMAYEQWPGRTPYTAHSELQNAETSAWGRAIVAALAADTKRGIASAEEVRNRVAERQPNRAANVQREMRTAAAKAIGEAQTRERLDEIGRRITELEGKEQLTPNEAVELRRQLVARIDELEGGEVPQDEEGWPETAAPGGEEQ